jgi:hypothetical protein
MEVLKILQPELRLLSAEAAKKFPDIKEVIFFNNFKAILLE